MTHDPKKCPLCSTLRHPAQAVDGRNLAEHLAKHPMPKQKKEQ